MTHDIYIPRDHYFQNTYAEAITLEYQLDGMEFTVDFHPCGCWHNRLGVGINAKFESLLENINSIQGHRIRPCTPGTNPCGDDCREPTPPTSFPAKIKSDGKSGSYYDIILPDRNWDWVCNDDASIQITAADVMEHALGNDYDKSSIFKALVRLGKKEGVDEAYYLGKIEYHLNRMRERLSPDTP